MTISLIFRPRGPWTEPRQHTEYVRFSATWTDTTERLKREVQHLQPSPRTDAECVIEVDASERDVRRDGFLRADAKVRTPQVVVSFPSIHGPLRYASGRYEGSGWGKYLPGWQGNVRAVALGLEALRAVDRYGIAGRGEQYTGWNALPPATPMGAAPFGSAAEAAAWLGEMIGAEPLSIGTILRDPAALDAAVRKARKITHPDAGGDADQFKRVTAARDLINHHNHR